jgi:dTMP kinase
VDSTRELPVVGAEPAGEPRTPSQSQPASQSQPQAQAQSGGERPRPEWAEETPLDDLPSLTDTLLGSHDEWTRWERGGQGGQDAPYGGPQSDAERPDGRGDAQGKGDGKGKGRRWGRRG